MDGFAVLTYYRLPATRHSGDAACLVPSAAGRRSFKFV